MTRRRAPTLAVLRALRSLRLPRTQRGRRRAAGLLALFVLAMLWFLANGEPRQSWPRLQILNAIRLVESGDRAQVPDGDGGLAIGPYQIHEIYWRDAIAFEPSLGGSYQDCRRRAYAERVIDAYMRKWIPAQWARGEAEAIAKVHNGGPKGADNPKTSAYWDRVRALLP
jgi:hypothetical protein